MAEVPHERPELPVDALIPDVLAALRADRRVVLRAPPGSGKTTRVPPALAEALAHEGRVLVLEPRRIAARAAADFVSRERGEPVGRGVGYQVRFERVGRADTRLWYLTEGMLTRRLASDPFLEGVAALVLDEFHERHMHGDVALAVAHALQATVRSDLRLVVMSATLDATPLAAHLGDCPVLVSEGRQHPVAVEYLASGARASLQVRIAGALERVLAGGDRADVLVFLPGLAEIRRAAAFCEPLAARYDRDIVTLHGNMPLDEQQRALSPGRRRRIVLSTNVAESALTIEGVDTVVDSGLVRIARYDARHGINRLELVDASQASADQRAGRAGRLGPGLCLRLWSSPEHAARRAHEVPEIMRLDLAEMVLQLRSWGLADPATLAWLDKPPPATLRRAEELLVELGAIGVDTGKLTPMGERMLRTGASPRLARMLVAAEQAGERDGGCLVAALASERDIRRVRRATPTDRRPYPQPRTDVATAAPADGSDLIDAAELFREAARRGFARHECDALGLDPGAVRAVERARRQFAGRSSSGSPVASRELDPEVLRRCALVGFPDRVVRRRASGSLRGVMVGGTGVVLDAESAACGAEFYVAIEVEHASRGARSEARVRTASAIEPDWLAELLPGNVRTERHVVFDELRERVIGRLRRTYLGVPLEEMVDTDVDPSQAAALLAEVARADPERAFSSGEAERALLARLEFLRIWLPESDVPAGDRLWDDVLVASCAGRTSLAELRRVSLVSALRRALPHHVRTLVDAEAPVEITLPSGRRAAIRYDDARAPVVAARVQEIFGLAGTPCLACGRARLVVEILAPNMRPVQRTDDLSSFWQRGYPEVRKQLRGRYPKHDWPEDPLTARPLRAREVRGRRR